MLSGYRRKCWGIIHKKAHVSYRNGGCGKLETWTLNLLNTEDQGVPPVHENILGGIISFKIFRALNSAKLKQKAINLVLKSLNIVNYINS